MHTDLQTVIRFEAIFKLQQNLASVSDDPYKAEVYELALEYALNPKRRVAQNFYRRLINDGKRLVRRKNQLPDLNCSLFTVDDDGDEHECYGLPSSYENPEQDLIYSDTIEQIGKACVGLHQYAPAIFGCIVEGYTVVEIAKRLTISESLVKKVRSAIVSTARKIILN